MRDTKIKLDVDYINEQINQMELACSELEAYSDGIFNADLNNLSRMKSDFVDVLIRVIEITQKSHTDDLEGLMREYIKLVQGVVDTIVETDEQIAEANKLEVKVD